MPNQSRPTDADALGQTYADPDAVVSPDAEAAPVHRDESVSHSLDETRVASGAAEDVAPRAADAGSTPDGRPTPAPSAPAAVDANHPADVVGQAGMQNISGPRFAPNRLQRGAVIGPGDHLEADTPGEELSDETLAGEDTKTLLGRGETAV